LAWKLPGLDGAFDKQVKITKAKLVALIIATKLALIKNCTMMSRFGPSARSRMPKLVRARCRE
jgi:hypothetical protein